VEQRGALLDPVSRRASASKASSRFTVVRMSASRSGVHRRYHHLMPLVMHHRFAASDRAPVNRELLLRADAHRAGVRRTTSWQCRQTAAALPPARALDTHPVRSSACSHCVAPRARPDHRRCSARWGLAREASAHARCQSQRGSCRRGGRVSNARPMAILPKLPWQYRLRLALRTPDRLAGRDTLRTFRALDTRPPRRARDC
jgi:hypothetical protein